MRRQTTTPARDQAIVATVALTWAAASASCGGYEVDFLFVERSPAFVLQTTAIEGQDGDPRDPARAQLPLLWGEADILGFAGGWTTFAYTPDVASWPPELRAVTVEGAWIEAADLAAGTPVSLAFVDRLEVFVIGTDGLPSFLLAAYTRQPDVPADPGRVVLDAIEPGVDLLPYVQAGATLLLYVQGRRPEQDVVLRLAVDLHAFAATSS